MLGATDIHWMPWKVSWGHLLISAVRPLWFDVKSLGFRALPLSATCSWKHAQVVCYLVFWPLCFFRWGLNLTIPCWRTFKELDFAAGLGKTCCLKAEYFASVHFHWKVKVKVKLLSCVQLFGTPWLAYLAPPSMGFSRQEYWSGVPFPSPGDLPNPGIEPGSPAFQADALTSEPRGKPLQKIKISSLILKNPLFLLNTKNLCYIFMSVNLQSLAL